jgi:hypothetical protein
LLPKQEIIAMKTFHWLLGLCLIVGTVGCTAKSDTPETPSEVEVEEGGEEVDPGALLDDATSGEEEAAAEGDVGETSETTDAGEGAAEETSEESGN